MTTTTLPRNEEEAYDYLEDLRWPNGVPSCPHCGNVGAWRLRPSNGVGRRTRTGGISRRRLWRCSRCRKQFSVLVGTVLQNTKIPIRVWVGVITDLASGERVSSRSLAAKYGVHSGSTGYMMRRLRVADPLSLAPLPAAPVAAAHEDQR